MTFWLRLLFTIIKAQFQKKLSWNEEVIQEFSVWITEADLSNLNDSRYLNFQELSKVRQMIGLGVFNKIVKMQWQPLASFHIIKYELPIKRFQKFKLRSNIVYFDEKFIYQQYRFERKNLLMASIIVKACFYRKGGVVRVNDFFKLMGMDAPTLTGIPDVIAKMNRIEKALIEYHK